jgi:hypothetical protein
MRPVIPNNPASAYHQSQAQYLPACLRYPGMKSLRLNLSTPQLKPVQ